MPTSNQTAKVKEINDPAPKSAKTAGATPSDPERRTTAPTPGATSASGSSDGESVMDTARDTAAKQAEAAKKTAAERANEQAERVREAGESFEDGSMAKEATDRIAENISAAAQSIENTDLAALGDDLARFARRQPLLFFGGAALLGFAAGRVLKASERAEYEDEFDYEGRL